MEYFLLGVLVGAAVVGVFFVLWNLERPDALDSAEAKVRDLTDEYEEAKAKVKAKIRKK
jgi:hypothetical protein